MKKDVIEQKILSILHFMRSFCKIDRVEFEKFAKEIFDKREAVGKDLFEKIENPNTQFEHIFNIMIDKKPDSVKPSRCITNLKFIFSADEIIESSLLGLQGCTGFAKVFYKLAEDEGLDVRFSISVLKNEVLEQKDFLGKYNCLPIVSGHNTVAVNFGDYWKIVNTVYLDRIVYTSFLSGGEYKDLEVENLDDVVGCDIYDKYTSFKNDYIKYMSLTFDCVPADINSLEDLMNITWKYAPDLLDKKSDIMYIQNNLRER